jgi:hypothetical protein
MDIDAKSKGRAAPSPRDDIFIVRRTIKNGDFSSQKRGSFGALASTFEQCDFASMCPDGCSQAEPNKRGTSNAASMGVGFARL